MAILLIERKGQEDEKFALPDKEVRIDSLVKSLCRSN